MSRSHGMSSMPEYRIWAGMKARCYNERHGKFRYYGGRGIGVCARWRNDFPAFLEDVGPRPSPAHSLGRLDNDGNYEPGNVEWQTMTDQQRNTGVTRFHVHNGERKSTTEWAEIIGVSETTIRRRIAKGVPIDEADVPAMRAAEERYTRLWWQTFAEQWNLITWWHIAVVMCAENYRAGLAIGSGQVDARRGAHPIGGCECGTPSSVHDVACPMNDDTRRGSAKEGA